LRVSDANVQTSIMLRRFAKNLNYFLASGLDR